MAGMDGEEDVHRWLGGSYGSLGWKKGIGRRLRSLSFAFLQKCSWGTDFFTFFFCPDGFVYHAPCLRGNRPGLR